MEELKLMEIKIFKNKKKLNNFFLKLLKNEIKKNNSLTLGISYDQDFFQLHNDIIFYKKIDWSNIKIFPMVEYFENQSNNFSSLLKSEFISNWNKSNLENFINIRDNIDKLNKENNLNDLYKINIDLAFFKLDFRGNFLLNDYKSKLNFINISTNGSDIISPGIKSILLFEKIIIICDDDRSGNIVKKLVSKKIDENDPYTFLNFHKNAILLTTKNLLNKNDIIKTIDENDIEIWSKKIFKDSSQDKNVFNNTNYQNDNKFIDENKDEQLLQQDKSLDKELAEALDIINENKTNENFEEYLVDENLENEVFVPNLVEEALNNEYKSFDNNYFENYLDENNIFINEDNKNNLDEEIKNHEFVEDDLDKKYVEEEKKPIEKDNDYFFNKYLYDTDKSILQDSSKNNIENTKEIEDIEYDLKINDNLEKENMIENKNNITQKNNNVFQKKENSYSTLSSNEQLLKSKEPNLKDNINLILNKKTMTKDKKDLQINFLKKLIKIKEDTLNELNNIQSSYSSTPRKFNIKENKMKFKYIPGMRPTPMLAVYDTPNIEIFNSTKKEMYEELNIKSTQEYFELNKHLWNGSYLIYDDKTLEINSVVFSNFSTFIFLLRFLNKEVWLNLPKEYEDVFKEGSKNFIGEFSLN